MAARGRKACRLIGHLDDQRLVALHRGKCGLNRAKELGIGQHDLRFAMAQDIGDCADIKAHIDRIQDSAAGRHAEMRLDLGGRVRQNGCHHIPGRNTAFDQGRGKAGDANEMLGIAAAKAPIHQRCAVWEHAIGADQMRQRGERHVIGLGLLKPCFILHPTHIAASLAKLPAQTCTAQMAREEGA